MWEKFGGNRILRQRKTRKHTTKNTKIDEKHEKFCPHTEKFYCTQKSRKYTERLALQPCYFRDFCDFCVPKNPFLRAKPADEELFVRRQPVVCPPTNGRKCAVLSVVCPPSERRQSAVCRSAMRRLPIGLSAVCRRCVRRLPTLRPPSAGHPMAVGVAEGQDVSRLVIARSMIDGSYLRNLRPSGRSLTAARFSATLLTEP